MQVFVNTGGHVFLGDPPTCTFPVFTREQRKHVCWVLLWSFRLPRKHEYSFQCGLGERRILEVLHGLQQTKENRTENDPTAASGTPSQPVMDQEAGSVCRKAIQAQDVCPICQEELLERKQHMSLCRCGCGTNFHICQTGTVSSVQGGLSLSEITPGAGEKRSKALDCRRERKARQTAGTFLSQLPGLPCHRKCLDVPSAPTSICDCSKKGCHPQHPFASRTERREKWELVEEDLSDEPSLTEVPTKSQSKHSPASLLIIPLLCCRSVLDQIKNIYSSVQKSCFGKV
ncbi:E3 ubiquitin-protein ligase ZSWIM2 [Plectropomus leopardus]|uniref:E3 ubiquitin-protein ligase ZSWIM2 n=1 Tax=Plectropomus leopardus TaxID=160734 RepID=UPI001C4B7208|nr:E3 ubiquitin-protein ligase ZSWIM2 [Plectropomus leopardus]